MNRREAAGPDSGRPGTLRRCALGALAFCAATCTWAAEPASLLPLVDPPTNRHFVGKFVLAELVTPDLRASKAFYGGLFGWTFGDVRVEGLQYAEASLNGQLVGEMVHRPARPGEQRQPAWLGFVAVTDVDAAQKAAVAAGARALLAPHDFPGRGRMAVLADPQGAVFGIVASTSGDPPEELADPGEWIWTSLFTTDPDTAAAFYQTLFDYDVFDDPEPQNAQHLVLASGGYSRAAANPLPSATARPHWLPFVRVDDAGAATRKAVSLGGKVLLSPRDDRHGGQIAVVADPQGAAVGLLEWPEDRNTKGLP